MKTTSTYSLIAVLAIFTISTHAQSWQWAEKLGNTDGDFGMNVSMDTQGNCLVAAGAWDIASCDMYFVKMDSTGAISWGLTYGGAGFDYGQEIITDALGNYYLLGTFEYTMTIGNYTLVSNGAKDMFIAKLDPNLNVLWAKSGGSTGNEEPLSIKVDNSGNCYMITPFENTATFDNLSLTTAGGFDIAFVKYDSNGNVVWAKQAGGIGNDIPMSISLDATGNIIMGGHFSDNCNFGSTTLSSAGMWDTFIAKYDPSGTVVWANSYGGLFDDSNTIVRVGADNNIYLVGMYSYIVNFDAIQLTSLFSSLDLFVAKYEASTGNILWAKSAGSPAVDVVYNMILDAQCNIYFTGYYGSTAQFGSIPVPGSYDLYIAKYDSSGAEKWVKNTIGTGGQHTYEAWGVAVNNDNVYVTGSFANDLYFDNSSLMLSPAGMYVAKINQTITGITEPENSISLNVSPNPCSTCYLETEYLSENFRLTDITGRIVPVQFNKTTKGYSFTLPKAGNMFFLTHMDSGRTLRIVSE